MSGPREHRLLGGADRNSAYPDTAFGAARPAGSPTTRTARTAGEQAAGETATGLLFLAGLWLVLAPWVLSYEHATAVAYAEAAAGGLVALVAVVRLVVPLRPGRLTWVPLALGAWTVCAPFVLDYPAAFDRSLPLWNEIVTGAVVIALAVARTVQGERQAERAAGTTGRPARPR